MEQKLDFEHRLSCVETRVETLEGRQDNLDALVSTVSALAVREERMENDVKEIKADVKMITGKAGKRWDFVVEKALHLVVAAIVGFLLASMGLSGAGL